MAEFSDFDLYDTHYLIETFEQGWRNLAELGNRLHLREYGRFIGFGCKSKGVTHRIREGFNDILADLLFNSDAPCQSDFYGEDILALAAVPSGKLYPLGRDSRKYVPGNLIYGVPEKGARLNRILKQTLRCFAESSDIGEAFSMISTEKNRERYIKNTLVGPRDRDRWQECFSIKITGQWQKAMKWLLHGLNDKRACEEAWWSCVYAYMEPLIEIVLDIDNRLKDDVPLTDEQIGALGDFMQYGIPAWRYISEADGRGSYRVVLEPAPDNMNMSELNRASYTFLVLPAFELAKRLERSYIKPRFHRGCRAPSCGKTFYTGHADATNCPGSRGGKKNRCSLDWIRYKRYLKKIGKDPESDWDNEQLKKAFIVYAKS